MPSLKTTFALIIGLCVVVWIIVVWRSRARERVSPEDIQAEYVSHLLHAFPELAITEAPRELRVRHGDGEPVTHYLDNLIEQASRSETKSERQKIYDRFGHGLVDAIAGTNTDRAKVSKEQILPRLIDRVYLEQMQARHFDAVLRPLSSTGLYIAYVVDEERSIRYLEKSELVALSLSEDALHDVAMANFRPRLTKETLAKLVDEPKKASLIASGDGFDATRLLLLMEYVQPGQVFAVVIPDTDTLFVVPQPDADMWEGLVKLAQTPGSGKPLIGRPLRLTSLGLEIR